MAKVKNAITENGTLAGAVTGLAEGLLDSATGALSPLNNFGRYFTGSRAMIKINDKLFGFAFGVTYSIKTSVTEINTIDDWTPYELAPQRITIDGTLSMFHIPNKGPTREFVQANVLSFLFHKYVTIEIRDQTTNALIFQTQRAVITSKTQNIQAGELSTIVLSWKAIGWLDELTPFYPSGYNGEKNEEGGGGLTDALKNLKKSSG